MNNKKYKVGDFVIDVAGHRVFEGEITKNIEPRVLSALHYFLEHAGEVVTRENLITEVWSDIIVTDHAVTQCIGNIRKIFHDRATEPKFIETIPKRGYRFIAQVSVIEDAQDSPEETAAELVSTSVEPKGNTTYLQEEQSNLNKNTSASQLPKQEINWLWFTAVVILIGLLVKDFFYEKESVKKENTEKKAEIKFVPTKQFTNLPGVEHYPRISPDQRFIAYVWEDENRPSDLFIQSIDHENSPRRQLTFTDYKETHPAWSPEGDRVAFIQYAGTQDCQVKIINIHSLKELYEATCNLDQNIGLHLSWSPDGSKIAIPHFEEGENSRGLIIHEIASKNRLRIKCHYQCDYIDFDVSWSPDNKHIALTRLTSMMGTDIFLYDLGDLKKPEKQLTNIGAQIIGHSWMSDNKRIVFSSGMHGYPSLYSVDIETLEIEALNINNLDAQANILFPDIVGNKLTFVAQLQEFFISRVDLPKLNDRSLPELPVKPLVRTSSFSLDPTYSEREKQLAYISDQSGHFEIWSADLKSPKFQQLTNLEKSVMHPKWSPNGKYIAFIASDIEVETSALYLLEVMTGHSYPLKTELTDFWVPEWSHDSESIFVAAKEEGSQKLYSVPIDGSKASVIATNGLYGKMSKSGDYFFYVKKGEAGLWQHNINTGSQQLIIPELEDFNWGNWDLSSEGIYYLTSNSSVDVINFYNLNTEESYPLAKVPKLTISKFSTGVFEIIEETHSLVFVQNGLLQGDIYISDLTDF
jgi:Tol biopolymer transport system component/DNA-binding winged helix-turn-helix (wHTH) protein